MQSSRRRDNDAAISWQAPSRRPSGGALGSFNVRPISALLLRYAIGHVWRASYTQARAHACVWQPDLASWQRNCANDAAPKSMVLGPDERELNGKQTSQSNSCHPELVGQWRVKFQPFTQLNGPQSLVRFPWPPQHKQTLVCLHTSESV